MSRFLRCTFCFLGCVLLLSCLAPVFIAHAIEKEETIFIYNPDDLYDFARRVNEGDEKAMAANVLLQADLDLEGCLEWLPIGYEEYHFSGHFDGQDHSIKHLTLGSVKDGQQVLGLFGVNHGEIKNLSLVELRFKEDPLANMDQSGPIWIGGLAAINLGLIEDVYVSGDFSFYMEEDGPWQIVCGPVAGENFSKISRAHNSSHIDIMSKELKSDSGYTLVGGITGSNSFGASILRASNSGSIMLDHDLVTVSRSGGIAGNNYGRIDLASNHAYLYNRSPHSSSGGIAGAGEFGEVYNAYNLGVIEADRAGGILGMSLDGKIYRCYNAGEIKGDFAEGSLVGCAFYMPVEIVMSYYLDCSHPALGLDLYQKPMRVEAKAISLEDFSNPDYLDGLDWIYDWTIPPYGLNNSMPSFHYLIDASLLSPPDKLQYNYGEALDLSGGDVLYSHGYYEEIVFSLREEMLSVYNPEMLGIQVLEVKDDYLDEQFTVEVVDVNMSIRLIEYPEQLRYLKGEEFDPTGGIIELSMASGHLEYYPLQEEMVTGFKPEEMGIQTLVITLFDLTCTLEVEVYERVLLPSPSPSPSVNPSPTTIPIVGTTMPSSTISEHSSKIEESLTTNLHQESTPVFSSTVDDFIRDTSLINTDISISTSQRETVDLPSTGRQEASKAGVAQFLLIIGFFSFVLYLVSWSK